MFRKFECTLCWVHSFGYCSHKINVPPNWLLINVFTVECHCAGFICYGFICDLHSIGYQNRARYTMSLVTVFIFRFERLFFLNALFSKEKFF